ncbi:MAG: hypothetical protein KJ000_32780 [Pirellulaceae bacterium]|nr:hypothetical protein [Pirellulaceae bacterium]
MSGAKQLDYDTVDVPLGEIRIVEVDTNATRVEARITGQRRQATRAANGPLIIRGKWLP